MTAVAVIHVKHKFVLTNEPHDMKLRSSNGFERPRTWFRLLIEFEWYSLVPCPLLSIIISRISISIRISGTTTTTNTTVASTGGSSTANIYLSTQKLSNPTSPSTAQDVCVILYGNSILIFTNVSL
jgi:hypothetical protein